MRMQSERSSDLSIKATSQKVKIALWIFCAKIRSDHYRRTKMSDANSEQDETVVQNESSNDR